MQYLYIYYMRKIGELNKQFILSIIRRNNVMAKPSNFQLFIQDAQNKCVTSIVAVSLGIVLSRRTPDRTSCDR